MDVKIVILLNTLLSFNCFLCNVIVDKKVPISIELDDVKMVPIHSSAMLRNRHTGLSEHLKRIKRQFVLNEANNYGLEPEPNNNMRQVPVNNMPEIPQNNPVPVETTTVRNNNNDYRRPVNEYQNTRPQTSWNEGGNWQNQQNQDNWQISFPQNVYQAPQNDYYSRNYNNYYRN